jgi:hypothetical protein
MSSFKKSMAAAAIVAAALALTPGRNFAGLWQEGFSGSEYTVLNVLLPMSLDFTIDPFEVNGRGQVHSEEYVIRNLGDTGVTVSFDSMGVDFAGEGDFEALPEPFDENSGSGRKSIYLSLNFSGGRFPSVVMTDAQAPKHFSALLEAPVGGSGSSLSFSFSGSVNHLPSNQWEEGDVKVEITYSLEAAETPAQIEEPLKPDEPPLQTEEPLEPAEPPLQTEEPLKPAEPPLQTEEPLEPAETPGQTEEPLKPAEPPLQTDEPLEPAETPGQTEEPLEPLKTPGPTEEPLEPLETPGQTEEPLEPVETPGPTEEPLGPLETLGPTEEPLEPLETPGPTEEPLEPLEPPGPTEEPQPPDDSQPIGEGPPDEPAQGAESGAAEGPDEKLPAVAKAP